MQVGRMMNPSFVRVVEKGVVLLVNEEFGMVGSQKIHGPLFISLIKRKRESEEIERKSYVK